MSKAQAEILVEMIRSAMHDLKPLLSPKGIVVVGASPKPGAGSQVIENLMGLGYTGGIYPVNPRYEEVLGYKCHDSLEAIPPGQQVDAVAIVLGFKQVSGMVEQAARRGVKAAWAFASGFAETGPEGKKRQAELAELCRNNGIRFCGPNCVGLINMHDKAALFSAPLPPGLKAGNVGVIAQSGSVALALVNSNRGVGFSQLISSGNEAVLDTTDYMRHMLADDNTRVICAFLEGIRKPKEFAKLCDEALQLNKPVVVLKVGRSELAKRTVVTHTGALAGEEAAFGAFLERHGVVQVQDLDELLETAELFSHCASRLPAGNRVGAITVSGGEIGLMGDISQGMGLNFPPLSQPAADELARRLPPFSPIGNPLDAWGSGDLRETYPACLEVLAKEKEIDLILVSQDSPPGMAAKQVDQYADVARAAVKAAQSCTKPVVVFSHVSTGVEPGLTEILAPAGVPLLQGSRESLGAVARFIKYAEFRRKRSAAKPPAAVSPDRLPELRQALADCPGVLGWDQSRDLLAAYGIELCPGGLTGSLSEAKALAADIGYPVALKAQSGQIHHRTEAGLVRLAIQNPDQLEAAWQELQAGLQKIGLAGGLEGLWLQKMAPPEAVELIMGLNHDPQLGPVLVLGLGGILVELLRDTVIGLPPLSMEQAAGLLDSLKGARLLQGFRGKPAVDREALCSLLVNLSRLAVDLGGEIESLDLNPVMALPEGQGAWVVDILIQSKQAGKN
jgi:acyl-CoA synthetase (NDP forming)